MGYITRKLTFKRTSFPSKSLHCTTQSRKCYKRLLNLHYENKLISTFRSKMFYLIFVTIISVSTNTNTAARWG